jgi:ERCC4-type nuclease
MSSDSDSDEAKDDGRNSFYILVDHRERHVTPYMDEDHTDIPFFVEHLSVGDYAIMYRGILLVAIERKSWKDMADSIKDGRINNVSKLLEIRETTTCSLVYLIEGKAFPNLKRKVRGISYKCMQAHLDHIMFRDNVSHVQTANSKHTARRIFEMTTNIISMGVAADIDKKIGGCVKKRDDTAKLKKKHIKSDDAHLYEIWKAIPWITSKTASLIIDDGISVRQFIMGEVDIDTLSALRYPSGVIVGKKRAKKMLVVTQAGAKSHGAVLRAVPNVGKTIAKSILEVRGLLEWLEMDPDDVTEELEDLKNGNRAAVNDRAKKNLLKFLWSVE